MHLYFHVPFCARRCSYCDFAIAVRREVPARAYLDAVLREWEGRRNHPAWERSPTVETVYFGGGTPSLIEPAAIGAVLDRVAADRGLSPAAEITLEANPDDVTAAAADTWRRAGVNRVSLGVQSFNPAVLRWMHRTHSEEQVPTAVETLRQAGFGELSLDLIFGLPASLGRRWGDDLAAAISLGPEHLSLYGLTIEEGTPLHRWAARGEVTPVDEARYASEFLEADALLGSTGYDHYEVSNYARPGRRARHNSAYWRRAPFLGLGPSAHSGWGRSREWNIRDWVAYQRAVATGGDWAAGREELDGEAVALEELYLGLRTRSGVPVERIGPETREAWLGEGWAHIRDGRLLLTAEGWLRLDALTASAATRFPLVL